jgi:AP-2 complex subunit alpha
MIPYAIHILSSLVLKRACGADYLYYRTPSPWLQIKLLRFLQYYPDLMSSGQTYVPTLKQILARILNDTDVSDSINKSNADHAILFEAISTIVVFGDNGDVELQNAAMRLLGKFISVREVRKSVSEVEKTSEQPQEGDENYER